MTTLTKARFFELTEIRYELVKDVGVFGDVWLRDVPEVRRSMRITRMVGTNGQAEHEMARRKLYELIDQVCIDDKGTPMFTEEDLPQLEKVASSRLDPLLAALQAFNGDGEKNDPAGSTDSSKS